jgi:hypothetical protein
MSRRTNAAVISSEFFGRRIKRGLLLAVFVAGIFSGCSSVPNPARRLVNHLSTKTSEARMRSTVEKDKFPTAQEAGLD